MEILKWFWKSYLALGNKGEVAVTKEKTGNEHISEAVEGEGTEPKEGEAAKAKESTPSDPEIEVDGQKVKLSEIKNWRKSFDDYSTKSNELAEQQKQVQDLVSLAEYLNQNPKKAEKVLAILEAKEEEAREEGHETELGQILSSLSDEDPLQKAVKALFAVVQGIQKDVGYFKGLEAKSEEETVVSSIQQSLNESLESFMKDPSVKFKTDTEKKRFRKDVLQHLSSMPENYNPTKEQFALDIKKIAKLHYEELVKMREEVLANYLKSKKGESPIHGAEGEGRPEEITKDNLQTILEKELAATIKEE